jgi:hypothetical protein
MRNHFCCPVGTKSWSCGVLDKVSLEVFEVAECARSSMDRASDFGSEGWGFKSLRAHHKSISYVIIDGSVFIKVGAE